MAEGKILLAGSSGTLNDNDMALFLMMIDRDGVEVWRASPASPGFIDSGSVHVAQTADEGFILAAGFLSREKQVRAWSGTEEGEDIALIRLNATGDVVWSKTFGGGKWDAPRGVITINEEGYVVVGATLSFGSGGEDIYLVKTDTQGVEEWSRTIGTTENEMSQDVARTIDGGFIIVGGTMSDRSGKTLDTYIVKTDGRGYTWVEGEPFSSPGTKPPVIRDEESPTTAPPGTGDVAQVRTRIESSTRS